MEFLAQKADLQSAFEQTLSSQNETSSEVVKLTAENGELLLFIPGMSVGIPAETSTSGVAKIPAGVLFTLARMCSASSDERLSIAVKNGGVRVQKTNVSA